MAVLCVEDYLLVLLNADSYIGKGITDLKSVLVFGLAITGVVRYLLGKFSMTGLPKA